MAEHKTSIPPSVWENGWRVRASAWSAPNEADGSTILRTLRDIGDMAPDVFPPPWSLHLGLAETLGTPQVRFLANGFELFYAGMADPAMVRCLMTPDGLWVGEASLALRPSLFSPENEVTEADGESVIELPAGTAALVFSSTEWSTRFSLCANATSRDEAMERARGGLDYPVAEQWEKETALRDHFWGKIRTLPVDVQLVTTSIETLAYHLVASTDGPRTSATSVPDRPDPHVNHLFPLVQSWLDIDERVATELVQAAIDRIEPDGSLPAYPGGEAAPWPTLVDTCLLLHQSATQAAFLGERLGDLKRYLATAIRRFDLHESGMVCWTRAEESFIPDTHDDNLASASLAAMLLNELEAFAELAEAYPDAQAKPEDLEDSRHRIAEQLGTTMWNPNDGVCHDRYIGGAPVARVTLSGLLPIGCKDLDENIRISLQQKAADPAFFSGPDGVRLWQEWDNDPAPPPVVSAHQIFVLHALKRAEVDTAWLEDRCAAALGRQLHSHSALAYDLRAGTIEPEDAANPTWFESPVVPACLAVKTCPDAARRDAEVKVAPWLASMDRHRVGILVGLVTIFVGLVLASVFNTYRVAKTPQVTEAGTTVQLVGNLMMKGDYEAAWEAIREARQADDVSPALNFFEANLLFKEQRYEEARVLYQQCIDDNVQARKATMNLALSYYREGRVEEAQKQYETALEKYGENEAFATLARTALSISRNYPALKAGEEE